MNNYCFVINETGERVTSIVDNALTDDELVKKAKSLYPNFDYEIGDGDMLNQFLSGKIYKEGKFVDAPVVEPTATEIKKTKMAQIKDYYDKQFDALDKVVLRRRLANTDISDLQTQYKTLQAEMVGKIKEVK